MNSPSLIFLIICVGICFCPFHTLGGCLNILAKVRFFRAVARSAQGHLLQVHHRGPDQ